MGQGGQVLRREGRLIRRHSINAVTRTVAPLDEGDQISSNLLRCICRMLALFSLAAMTPAGPLAGVNRTSRGYGRRTELTPTRSSGAHPVTPHPHLGDRTRCK